MLKMYFLEKKERRLKKCNRTYGRHDCEYHNDEDQ